MLKLHSMILCCWCASQLASPGAEKVDSDVCVYGATSGGVVASVSAARLGKSVVLLSLNNHIGGMTASGLGVRDIGGRKDPSYIGGITHEFYQRIGRRYGASTAVYSFEPHVAEEVFWQMASDAGVTIYTNQRLAAVILDAKRI